MLTEELHGARVVRVGRRDGLDLQLALDRRDTTAALDPRRQPAADIAAARHGREIVNLLQETKSGCRA
jgi:hypothetical protein